MGLEQNETGWLSIIPEAYSEASLENCPDLPEKLVQYGHDWVKNLPLKSLFLYGCWGSGKTWFSFSLIREVMRKYKNYGVWPRYVTGKELDSDLLKEIRNPDGDLERLKFWASQDILFIDEVEKVSRDETGKASNRVKLQLFEILNRRTLANLPTIMTSNYSPNELGDVIDGSLISRMGDQSKWKLIRFPDKDLRKIQIEQF